MPKSISSEPQRNEAAQERFEGYSKEALEILKEARESLENMNRIAVKKGLPPVKIVF